MDSSLEALKGLLETVRILRGPGGCSWDRDQTLESLRPYMLEEAYEVADAVDRGDMNELEKELGDLLLHIFMAAEISMENGGFHLAGVAERITQKLRRRHPHVFQGSRQLTPEQVEKQWEAIKASEKQKESKRFFDSIPGSMPALQQAWRLQQRSEELGFTWPDRADSARRAAEFLLGNCTDEETLGKALFFLANYCRLSGVEPERALRVFNTCFKEGFNNLEDRLEEQGLTVSNADEKAFSGLLLKLFG